MTYQSGAKVTEYEWGDKRNPDPDLVKVTESASGNYKRSEYERRSDKVDSITEYKDRKDGKVKYTSKEDGSDESVYKDGTIKQRDKSGNETIIKPSKEEIQPVTITDKDGNKVTTFTDDKEKRVSETRFYDHKHGEAREETIYKGREDHVAKKTDFLNRTEMTYENGSKTTEFDRGNRHNDPNLVRVSEKADGSYKRSDFADRFDKVESITEYNNRKDGRVKYTSRQDGSGEFVYKDGTIKEHDKFGNDTIIKPPPREVPQTK